MTSTVPRMAVFGEDDREVFSLTMAADPERPGKLLLTDAAGISVDGVSYATVAEAHAAAVPLMQDAVVKHFNERQKPPSATV